MKSKKTPNKGFTPQELEVLLRAKREHKQVNFADGFPKIVENQRTGRPSGLRLADECIEGGILSPANDLLSLFCALEGYLSHYVSELSKTDLRREDCLHMYEPDNAGGTVQLPSDLLQKITEKLGQITAERRHIKNRHEVIKFIHNGFMSSEGKAARLFLSKMLGDVAHLEKSQKARVYTPKTDAIVDILGTAAQMPPSTEAPPPREPIAETGKNVAGGTRRRPPKKRREPHVND